MSSELPRHDGLSAGWIVLTTGDRPAELTRALDSIRSHHPTVKIIVVFNGGRRAGDLGSEVSYVELAENVGVPAARDLALREMPSDVVFFLDDDAVTIDDVQSAALATFALYADVAVVTFRLVDEDGQTTRRHAPRVGHHRQEDAGPVPTFLGGACAIRRTAYLTAGGYFGELFYGHEELDLAWRLVDRGYEVRYLADQRVFHPRTEIGRHPRGWWLTGRNRVWIARRNLPWPVLAVHVLFWLVVGSARAPRGCRASYVRGWGTGWRGRMDRRPMSWRTVVEVARLGRPPVI